MNKEQVLSQEAKKELAIVQFESAFDTLTEKEYIVQMLTAYTTMRTGLNLKLKMYVRKQARIYKELKKYIEAQSHKFSTKGGVNDERPIFKH